MSDQGLEREIRAFDEMQSDLVARHGSVWAVVVDRVFQGGFAEFSQAAQFAVSNFPDKDYLIRHTHQHTPHIPFFAVEA